MAYTLVPTELIVDGAVTSAKLDTNISISGTLGVTGELTLSTHMNMGDNDKIKIGTGGDLEIYHDGSNSYISNSTGNIYLADTNGSVHIQAKLNEESIVCTADGSVSLYYDNAVKLATTASGVAIGSTNNGVGGTIDLSVGSTSSTGGITLWSPTSGTHSLGFGDGYTGTDRYRGYVEYAHNGDSMRFATAATERMRIDSSGNVGIGETSPDTALHVKTANDTVAVIESSDATAKLLIKDSDSTYGTSLCVTNEDFFMQVNGGEKLRINSSGNVGIGTNSPAAGLHIDSPDNSQITTILDTDNAAVKLVFRNSTETGNNIQIGADGSNLVALTNATEAMRIDSSGNVGIGHNSPSGFSSGANNLVVNDAAGAGGITIVTPNDAKGSIFFADGTSGSGQGRIRYNHNGDYMTFGTSGSEDKFVIDSLGNVGIGTNSPVNNGSGSQGLTINGTGNYQNLNLQVGGTTQFTIYTNGVSGTFINQVTADPMMFYTSDTERMRIDASGKVHIGATTGTGILNVDGGAGEGSIYVEGTHSGSAITARLLASDGGAVFFGSSSNHDLRIQTNGTNRMFITTSGTMGFGMSPLGTNNGSAFFDGNVSSKDGFMTTASDLTLLQPSAGNTIFVRDNGNESMRLNSSGQLVMNDSGRITQGSNLGTSGGTGGYELNLDTNAPRMNWYNDAGATRSVQYFYYEGTERGSIQVLAGSTSYLTSSDYRLKENVNYTWNATTRIKQLKPARFNFTNDTDNTVDGFLAHEVSSIVPNAISGTKDEVDSEGNPKYQGIDHSKLVPLLTKAIQEQQTIIDDLKSRIETLENE